MKNTIIRTITEIEETNSSTMTTPQSRKAITKEEQTIEDLDINVV